MRVESQEPESKKRAICFYPSAGDHPAPSQPRVRAIKPSRSTKLERQCWAKSRRLGLAVINRGLGRIKWARLHLPCLSRLFTDRRQGDDDE